MPRLRRGRSLKAGLAAGLVLSLTAALTGCGLRYGPSSDRMLLRPDLSRFEAYWPARYPETLWGGSQAEGTDDRGPWAPIFLYPMQMQAMDDGDLDGFLPLLVDHEALGVFGQGVLYRFSGALNLWVDGEPHPMPMRIPMEPASADEWLIFASTTIPPEELGLLQAGETLPSRATVRATHVFIYRPWNGVEPRGLAISIGSILPGSPHERALIPELQSRGWTVVELWPPGEGEFGPRVIGEGEDKSVEPADDDEPLGPRDQLLMRPIGYSMPEELARRCVEGRAWAMDIGAWRMTLDPTYDRADIAPEVKGREVAERVDDTIAELAYAAEAVVEYLARKHPEAPIRPLVVTGFSAGSMVAPAMAARLGGVDAAVLFAGGANAADILANGALAHHTKTRGWSRGFSKAERDRIVAAYLAASRLDPFHSASALMGTPVLMVLGAFDAIVPSRNGRLYYERLGRPELWHYAAGHVGLFVILPLQVNAIAEWIQRSVRDVETEFPAEK